MTTTPTPEQFLTEPWPDEQDDEAAEPTVPPARVTELLAINPADWHLESIAQSLRTIADSYTPREQCEHAGDLADAMQELADLEAKHDVLRALVEEIETIIKPSTSKLANSVRSAIGQWRNPELPEAELTHELPTGGKSPCGVHYTEGTFGVDPTCPECLAAEEDAERLQAPPAPDAPVEEWRAYAESVLPPISVSGNRPDVAQMNRSQIRTILGIEQPVAGEGTAEAAGADQ